MNIKVILLTVIFGLSLMGNTSGNIQKALPVIGLSAGVGLAVGGMLFAYGAEKNIKRLKKKDKDGSKIIQSNKDYYLSLVTIIFGMGIMGVSLKNMMTK